LNVVAAGHPTMIINMLAEEAKASSSDGFMSRFLLCVPEPNRISLKTIANLNNLDKNTMSNLFITIKLMHIKSIKYKFNKDAFEYLSDCIDDYNMISQKNERFNPFLR
jgi:hypothetical protein